VHAKVDAVGEFGWHNRGAIETRVRIWRRQR
jgi:hypothetical protein